MSNHQTQDSDITKAVNATLNCARTCMEAFQYCLDEKGTAFSGKHLSLLQACVDACHLTARLLIGESKFANQACELTFELCQACAVECERYEYDDVFKKAAANCHRCAYACKGMIGMAVQISYEEFAGATISQQ